MTKTLIAGLGSIGRRHLRNLVALGETDIILLRSHLGTLPDDELAGYPVETDLRQALRKHQPSAVIVANPSALHLSIAVPAARAGCAVLLEKPIAASMAGLAGLADAVVTGGSTLLVGFQFRFHPALLRARQVLVDGSIGTVMSAHVHFSEYLPAWHPWEDYRSSYAARADLGGGVLLTQCHSLDYLPWLVGRVQAVSGFSGKLGDLEVDVDDTAEIAVRFSAGQMAGIHLDFSQRPPAHRLEITGTRGSILCDLLDGTTRVFRVESAVWETYPLPEGWERNTMFMDEMRHFLAVARRESEPACTLDDGVRVMRLIDAIRRSNRSGRTITLED
jgi:predicted dehydrogenase